MAIQVEAGRHFEQFVTQMNRRKSSQKTKTVAADEVGEGERDTIGGREGGKVEAPWQNKISYGNDHGRFWIHLMHMEGGEEEKRV